MSRRSRRQRLPAEPVELTIESMSHEGRGVAHHDGKVAFVSGALPGETVSAKYQSRRGKFDELVVETVITASAERVEPPCQYAAVCGGCSLQHLAPEQQLAFKENVLLEHLQHAGEMAPGQFDLLPRLHGDSLYYRRKARLAVRVVQKKGGVLVGFREKASSFITDMQSCRILVPEVGDLISALRNFINGLEGRYQIPQIEVAVGENSADLTARKQVALVFRHLQALAQSDIDQLCQFAEQYDLHVYLQPGGTDTVSRLHPPQGEEAPRLHYYLPDQGLKLAFHPMDFTQVNAGINRAIVSRALEHLRLQATDKVLDLYCGLGNFTLAAARQAASVMGVEGSEAMVLRGQENAAANGIDNVNFAAADLSQAITACDWAQSTYDKIILDPPRSGAIEIIPEIARMGAQRIVYVSCNPITLARDSKILLEHGYDLKSAGVMDMFPHTTHVESMAVFERKS